ncbi:hypothetical protein GBAR_LOCUS26636 [Geodia barretti]|uniref:Uncharacterized protein n=1 Tax=Geodia barretti TaxID=519541 RepID=A0AA35TIE0_GEOBA|nr:hypothetical protein GBAR_LOCUS26636 [Geodia barretti]
MTDPVETANVTLDHFDTSADQVDITVDKTNSTKSFTKQVSANSTTDQIDTTDTATANPTDSSESTTDQIDTTDTASANPADQVDTSNVSTGTPDITNTATDTAEPSVKNEAVEKKEPTMAAGGREEETKVEEERNEEKEEEKNEEKEDEQKDEEKERGLTAAGNELPSAVDPSSGQHKPQTSIDKQLEEARKAREAEMKARATSLLTGKLGSLVRFKPSRPASAPISKPPLPPSASVTKPTRPPVTAGPKSPHRVPLSPTTSLGVNRRDPLEGKREGVPVVKPYLVKKGEEKPTPQATVPDRTMKDVKMAYRLPGWYKDMFQGFQQTVEELFPDSQSDAQHSRTISTPADMDTYVYDNRGLKVRKSSFSSSSPVSPIHTRSLSNNNTATTTAPPDPVYVYDHRGLRVRKDSLTAHNSETTPTTVTDLQEEVTTADVLAASRRQHSMDSGYDDRGLRLREGSQGNGDTDHDDTSPTTIAGEEVTKGGVIDAVKKPTAYKSDKFSTEPSRTYWSAIDQQFAEDQRKKREPELQQEDEGNNHCANSEEPSPNHRAKSEGTSPQQRMAHMHPLLTEGLEDVSDHGTICQR